MAVELIAVLVMVAAMMMQTIVGFGSAIVAAPVLLLLDPSLVPVAVLLGMWPGNVGLAVARRREVQWRSVLAVVVAAALAGVVVAAAVGRLDDRPRTLLVAGICTAAAVAVGRQWRLPVGPRVDVAAGGMSAIASVLAGINGVVLVARWAAESPLVHRANLSAAFALMPIGSLGALLIAGQVEVRPALVGVVAGVVSIPCSLLVERRRGRWQMFTVGRIRVVSVVLCGLAAVSALS